jgi:hypothetical protein
MTSSRRAVGALGFAFAIAAVCPALRAADDLPRWMNGCWGGSQGADQFHERWLVADAATMIGTSHTVRNGTLRSFEFLRVVLKDGRATYVAQPGGVPPTEFAAATASATEIVFENLAHDFPKRVAYRRETGDRLVAWIDGGPGSKQRVEYPMTRERCDTQP